MVMKKLSDYALAGMPNIRKDLGLETEMQKNLRLQQEGLLMGRQFGGLPAPIASLAQGIAANVPSIRDNVRQLGVEKGLNLQTESELFDLAIGEYDGTPESQARVVQSLTRINPQYGAAMADAIQTRNIQAEKNEMEREVLNIRREEATNRAENLKLEKKRLEREGQEAIDKANNQTALNKSYAIIAEQSPDPIFSSIAQIAANQDFSPNEFQTLTETVRSLGKSEDQIAVEEITALLMETRPDDFDSEDDARKFAEGLNRGLVKVEYNPDNNSQILTNLITNEFVVKNAPPPDIAVNENFDGDTLWSNRKLLSGFANTVGAALDIPLTIARDAIGIQKDFTESVDLIRSDARQSLRSGINSLRTAFDNDDRLTGVEIDVFDRDINVAPKLIDSVSLWSSRVISVDRTLKNKLGMVEAELNSANPDVKRRQKLLNQRQAIASFRQLLGVPEILDIRRVTEENLNNIDPSELKDMIDRASAETLEKYEKDNPEMEDLIADRLLEASQ